MKCATNPRFSGQTCALIAFLGLLATAISGATPIFDVGAGGGDGSQPIPVRLFFDGRNSPTESGALTFDFDANILQATESCASRIGDPLPDRLNFTHSVACSVDNAAGRVQLSFAPFGPGFTVSRRLSLGQIVFTVAEGFVPDVGGSHIPLALSSVSIPGQTGTGSVSGVVSVVQGWPIDSYEADDSPLSASRLTESGVSQFNSIFGFLQTHTLDNEQDEDWAFYQVESCTRFAANLRVSPITPIDFQSFLPIVEIYPAGRLLDSTIEPSITYGDCSANTGRDLLVNDIDLTAEFLIRVRNCKALPPSGLGYSLRVSFDSGCPQGVISYSGRVNEVGSDIPAAVFLRSSSNQYAASNLVTGVYNIVGLPDTAIELEVISDQYLPTIVSLPALAQNSPAQDFDIVVTPRGVDIFANSFE